MMNGKKLPRFYNRKFLVDSLQLRFAGHAIVHFTLIVMTFVGALFVPVILRLQSGDISDPYVQAAAHEFLTLHNNVWMPLVGALILVVLHNILITHRVAGPLYRFRPYLEAVGAGDLSAPIRFRKKDHLQKEAKVASQMVESLRGKVVNVERDFEEVSGTWNTLRKALDAGRTDGMQREISELSRQIEECRASLSVFKTADEEAPSAKSNAESPEEDPALLNV